MDSKQIAEDLLQRLAQRGGKVKLRKNRLRLHPSDVYSTLTVEEWRTFRTHYEAIATLVRSGFTPRCDPPRIADRDESQSRPRAENQKQIFCSYCHRAECASDPETRRLLHWNDPIEVAKRRESATTEMHVMLQRRRRDD